MAADPRGVPSSLQRTHPAAAVFLGAAVSWSSAPGAGGGSLSGDRHLQTRRHTRSTLAIRVLISMPGKRP